MINYNIRNLFKSPEFNKQFNNLFDDNGPLYYILKYYPNIPAKGGKKFPQYKDTTYFIHVLDTSYIGGLLLENDLLSRDVPLSDEIYNIKLFFASCIYHDFNKLEGKNIWKPEDYKELLENKKQILTKMLHPYFMEYDIDDVFNSIKYIILNVENSSKDSVNTTNIYNKETLSFIGEYISKGDSLSSRMSKNISEFEILKQLKLELSAIPNLNIVQFQKVPQTLLRNEVIKFTEEFLGKDILMKSPDWFILDKDYNKEELRQYVISQLSNIFNDVKDIASAYPPSNNKVEMGFYRDIEVTQEFLEKFMDIHKGKLLLYQKINDIDGKYHLFDTLKIWHFDVTATGKVNYFEDPGDEFDTDIRTKSLRVRTAILRRMELELVNKVDVTEEKKTLNNYNIDIEDIDKITQKTLLSLAYSFEYEGNIENTYDKIINRVLKIFQSKREGLDHNSDEVYKKIVDRIFLNSLDLKTDIIAKDKLCIQCGTNNNNMKVDRVNSFGIKATSGTGSKVSVLEYDMYDGEICELCRLENSLRKNSFKSTNPLCIQVYTGDYVPPVNLDKVLRTVADNLKSNLNSNITRIQDKKNEYSIILGNKIQIPMIDHHNLYFIDKLDSNAIDNTISEFFLLNNLLKLIQMSGLKIKLTSMFISGDSFYNTFKWESPPGWVKELSMDEIRIDEINSSIYLLDLINKLSKLRRGYKDLPEVISSILQNKMNIYTLLWNGLVADSNININYAARRFLYGSRADEQSILGRYEEMFNMEEAKTKMEKLVDIACKIDNEKPETNNDNTWIIRDAFEVYENNRLDKDHKINKNYRDIKQKISGHLFDTASRKNNSKSEDLQNACIEFGDYFVSYIHDEYNDVPKREIKRDIISQFGLLYNISKWNIENKSTNKGVKA